MNIKLTCNYGFEHRPSVLNSRWLLHRLTWIHYCKHWKVFCYIILHLGRILLIWWQRCPVFILNWNPLLFIWFSISWNVAQCIQVIDKMLRQSTLAFIMWSCSVDTFQFLKCPVKAHAGQYRFLWRNSDTYQRQITLYITLAANNVLLEWILKWFRWTKSVLRISECFALLTHDALWGDFHTSS